MWYVIQVFTGREEETKQLCKRLIPEEVLTDCFIPYRENMKKYLGKWHKEREILFPGYVFLITDRIEEVSVELKRVPGFTKLLGDRECLIALTNQEVAFIEHFGGKDRVTEMSVGFIINDKIQIAQGPLIGMEGSIRKIDRHKRKAWVEVEMFGRKMEVQIGLEIVIKNEEK